MNSKQDTVVRRGELLASVLIEGDLSRLSDEQRATYCARVCDSLGLNPLTKPFDFIKLNGKLVMYAKKDCTEQLRKRDGVSVSISARERIDDVYIVSAKARSADGREDESIGAVAVGGLKGEALANAMMKAETKAKRRVTLSICGLGMLDETEVTAGEPVRVEPPKVNRPQALPERRAEPGDDTDDSVTGEERQAFLADLHTLGKSWPELAGSDWCEQLIGEKWASAPQLPTLTRAQFEPLADAVGKLADERREKAEARKAKQQAKAEAGDLEREPVES